MSSFADLRLIVADLDGTLLDDEKQLDAGIVDVIKELEKRDIMFTLASGRNIHIMQPYLKELSLQLPFIANNGANMFQGDACIYEKSMESEELALLFSSCSNRIFHVLLTQTMLFLQPHCRMRGSSSF